MANWTQELLFHGILSGVTPKSVNSDNGDILWLVGWLHILIRNMNLVGSRIHIVIDVYIYIYILYCTESHKSKDHCPFWGLLATKKNPTQSTVRWDHDVNFQFQTWFYCLCFRKSGHHQIAVYSVKRTDLTSNNGSVWNMCRVPNTPQ